MFFNFFKKTTPDNNYYKLGGTRSFHKFKYRNKSIILMGEVHQKMPNDLANQYIGIFNQFVEIHPVSMFLESSDTEIEAPSSNGLGFIRSMKNLAPSPNLEMIPADKRDDHNDRYDGFLDFFCFLNKLAEIEEQIIDSYKEKHITPPKLTPFFKGQDFFDAATKVGDLYNKNYYFSDLYQFLDSSIKILDALADKHADQNKQVGAYIAECLLDVNEALGLLIKLEDEYRAMGFQDKDISNRRLIDICIDMMSKKGDFKPAEDWLHIFSLYESRFLDATLIGDIWDKIHYDDNERTLIVVMGDKHIVSLSSLLKIICDQEVSIPADRKGAIISPQNLNEYLSNHFEHAPSGECCIMM